MPKNSDSKVKLLEIPISRLGLSDAVDKCSKQVRLGKGGYVCFVNVHTLTESQSNPSLKESLQGAFLALADGVPLVWASRLYSEPVDSRVCGPDFMKAFIEANPDLRHCFVGGAPQQGQELIRRFKLNPSQNTSTCPPIRPFAAAHALEDWQECLARQNPPPQVVWVGLGAPKQENWMRTVSCHAPSTLFFGVGAAFDFLTGTKKRAPVWMQKSGLEWLFRLGSEPGRLWKRYWVSNSSFIYLLVKDYLKISHK